MSIKKFKEFEKINEAATNIEEYRGVHIVRFSLNEYRKATAFASVFGLENENLDDPETPWASVKRIGPNIFGFMGDDMNANIVVAFSNSESALDGYIGEEVL